LLAPSERARHGSLWSEFVPIPLPSRGPTSILWSRRCGRTRGSRALAALEGKTAGKICRGAGISGATALDHAGIPFIKRHLEPAYRERLLDLHRLPWALGAPSPALALRLTHGRPQYKVAPRHHHHLGADGAVTEALARARPHRQCRIALG